MANHFLSRTGPPELILCVFRHCNSVHDALALASACRHTYNTWLADGAGNRVAWELWFRDIPCAEEALVTVRAAQLVFDAESRDELPPLAMNLRELVSRDITPSLSELQAVRDIQRLAHCIEHLAESHCDLPEDRHAIRRLPPEDRERMPEWRHSFWKAIFRALSAGAALAGVYNEPLKITKNEEIFGLDRFREHQGWSDAQTRFMARFPVLRNVTTPEQDAPIFGFLERWLIEDILSDTKGRCAMAQRFERGSGRARACPNFRHGDDNCPFEEVGDMSHSDAHFVLWEVMKVYWMQDWLCVVITSLDNKFTVQGVTTPKGKAPVVLFPYFTAMKIKGPHLFATPFPDPHDDGKDVGLANLLLNAHKGQPWQYVDALEVAPLHLKLFEYLLRQRFNLCFHDFFFEGELEGDAAIAEESFLSTLTLFALDDVEDRWGSDYWYDMQRAGFLTGFEPLHEYDGPRLVEHPW